MKAVYAILAGALLPLSAMAQTDTAAQQPGIPAIVWGDITHSAHALGRFFTAPLRATPAEVATGAALFVAPLAMLPADAEVRDAALRNRGKVGNALLTHGAKYLGEPEVFLGLPAAVYLTGLVAGDTEIRTTGRILFEALTASGLTTTTLKILVGRSRPFTGNDQYDFGGFATDNARHSYPSGHTTAAFAVASVLSYRIDNTAASIALYTAASMTAYSRIYDNQHWLSDTALGAVIGTVAGIAFCRMAEQESDQTQPRAWHLSLSPTGFSFTYAL